MACDTNKGKSSVGSTVPIGDKNRKFTLIAGELTKIKPNELGSIMILEYHDIGKKEGAYSRSVVRFRNDLERLHREGYRLISLKDYLNGNFDIEPGLTPVVLTFDDSTPGQFRFLVKNGKVTVDPDCALGVLKNFCSRNSGERMKASFFVLYGCAPIHRLFAQEEFANEKIRFIVKSGMEIGNHTYSHGFLDRLDRETAVREIARSIEMAARIIPGYQVDVLALPGGGVPKDLSIMKSGFYRGNKYQNRAVLFAWGGPGNSPYSLKFDPYKIPRVLVSGKELDYWLDFYERYPQRRFISDGNPDVITVPKSRVDELNQKVRRTRKVRIY